MLTFQAYQERSYQKGNRKVARRLPLQERREVLARTLPEYCEASDEQKRLLPNTLTQMIGYHRTYATWLPNQRK